MNAAGTCDLAATGAPQAMAAQLRPARAWPIITAVVIEGRSQASVARDYGVSKGWVSKLIERYRAGLTPTRDRPRTATTLRVVHCDSDPIACTSLSDREA